MDVHIPHAIIVLTGCLLILGAGIIVGIYAYSLAVVNMIGRGLNW